MAISDKKLRDITICHYILPCSLTRHLLSMLQSFDNHYRSKYSPADTEREMARCSSVPTRLMCSTIVHLIWISAAVVRFPNPFQVSWGTWLIMRQFCVQFSHVPFSPVWWKWTKCTEWQNGNKQKCCWVVLTDLEWIEFKGCPVLINCFVLAMEFGLFSYFIV